MVVECYALCAVIYRYIYLLLARLVWFVCFPSSAMLELEKTSYTEFATKEEMT